MKHTLAHISHPRQAEAAGQDLLFLMDATYLILGESTFGFWAGWLSHAVEIHYPLFECTAQNDGRKNVLKIMPVCPQGPREAHP